MSYGCSVCASQIVSLQGASLFAETKMKCVILSFKADASPITTRLMPRWMSHKLRATGTPLRAPFGVRVGRQDEGKLNEKKEKEAI